MRTYRYLGQIHLTVLEIQVQGLDHFAIVLHGRDRGARQTAHPQRAGKGGTGKILIANLCTGRYRFHIAEGYA